MSVDTKGLKLTLRSHQPENTVVEIGPHRVGEGQVVMIAGPCSVESEEQLIWIAWHTSGILRGGCFKPRTSPYAFQGLGEEGLKMLKSASEATGRPTVTEVMAVDQVELVAHYADVLQVGARNMQNYDLLKALGQARKPVLLKRGISATVEEWLGSAEYILHGGNLQVILCERGVRTFGSHTRFTLDVSSIPVVKAISHLPVIVDPSHAAGDNRLVKALALAGVAAGADGLMVEVHHNPLQALSDAGQAITIEQFRELQADASRIALALGRSL